MLNAIFRVDKEVVLELLLLEARGWNNPRPQDVPTEPESRLKPNDEALMTAAEVQGTSGLQN